MIFGNLLTFLIAYVTLVKSYHYLDRVEHLPTSWWFEGILEERDEYSCYERCVLRRSKYFALSEVSTDCYCGNESPIKDSNNNHSHNHNSYDHNNNDYDENEKYYYRKKEGKKEVYGRSSLSLYSLFLLTGSDRTIYRRDDNDQITAVTTPQRTIVVPSTVAVTQSASASTASGTPTQPSLISSTITNANHETSVIYQTSFRTQSGSTVIQTVTQSATPSPTAAEDKSSKSHHHANVGAIVGGVVGGVGGAAVAAVLILLIVRHFNKRREQERMEQEYQEAIKPVEYIGYGKHGGSKGSSGANGLLASDISGDKSQQGADTSIISRGLSSGSFDDDLVEGTIPVISNPFDDPGRVSNPSPATHKILQVANPDEDKQ